MFDPPVPRSEATRAALADQLNVVVLSGLDFYGAAQVAHWNVKGPGFVALHELFGELRDAVADHNDDLAERAVTLGVLAVGTTQQVAAGTKLAAYPADTTAGLDHVKALVERLEAFVVLLVEAQRAANKVQEFETMDLLTQVLRSLEKFGWKLRAHLEPAT